MRRYYYNDENTPVTNRVRHFFLGKKVPPFPESILIQNISGCNARCVFCLQHQINTPQGRMSSALLEKIVAECRHHHKSLRRFSFAFDNEPLLDGDLAEKVAYVKSECPFVTTNITTNGILLKKDRIEELYETEAVDEINISIQGIDEETYYRLTGVKAFYQVMENMDDLEVFHREFSGKKPEIEINICLTPENSSRRKEIESHWQGKGFKTNFIRLDSRSGDGKEFKENIAGTSVPYHQRCKRPFHSMIICWDGTVPLCCADYGRKCVVGNVMEKSLSEVWSGERMVAARKELLSGKFDLARTCAGCRIDQ